MLLGRAYRAGSRSCHLACDGIVGAAACRVADSRLLAGALLLVDLLAACVESSGRTSGLVRPLDRCE